MNIVLQEEKTGCGLAVTAMVAGKSYGEIKALANSQGLYAHDEELFTTTRYVRKLLDDLGVKLGPREIAFNSWDSLPSYALLATKHRIENSKPRWHWCAYKDNPPTVLDPASYLEVNERQDFANISVAWYIPIY